MVYSHPHKTSIWHANVSLASLAQLANSILKINSEGSIDETINETTPIADSSLRVSDNEFAFNAFAPTLSLQTEKSQFTNSAVTVLQADDENPETKNEKGKKQEKGNDKVYRYYFKAAGRRNIAAFLACVVGLVFGLYFPREYCRRK